jgi:outer membrane protein TolC
MLCVSLASCTMPMAELPEIGPRSSAVPGAARPRSQPSEEDESLRAPAVPTGPIDVTIEEAVLLALENNRALRVERLNPPIKRTFEEQERAAFEPVLSAEVSGEREKAESRTGGTTHDSSTGAAVGVSEFLPTGTKIDVDLTTDRTWGTSEQKQHASRAGLTVTQSLLRGAGLGPNLANLRQARLDTQFSEYELRGFAEALVARVETTYWDYVLARRQVEIFEASLKLAEQQQEETQQRIRVGALAETELAAAQAEVALRREALINAHSRVATLRVRLLRLVHPRAMAALEREVTPKSRPAVAPLAVDALEDHVAVAIRMRPDMNQAQLLIQRGDLEIVKTKNGLLPRMDLFITLGKTGYADSFGRSVGDFGADGYDVFAGVTFEVPVTNREPRARHQRALLTRRQLVESLRNIEDLVREDVVSAHIEVRRARQQVDATAATRRFQEEKFRAETAKFRVGKSTALLVAQAQRDLVASQVAEVEAVTNHLKAMTELFRLEGSLLERRGINAPGREPVKAEAWNKADPGR